MKHRLNSGSYMLFLHKSRVNIDIFSSAICNYVQCLLCFTRCGGGDFTVVTSYCRGDMNKLLSRLAFLGGIIGCTNTYDVSHS